MYELACFLRASEVEMKQTEIKPMSTRTYPLTPGYSGLHFALFVIGQPCLNKMGYYLEEDVSLPASSDFTFNSVVA